MTMEMGVHCRQKGLGLGINYFLLQGVADLRKGTVYRVTEGIGLMRRASSTNSRRPLVVLAGWLGCKPSQLRRYEDLYRKQGFQVVSRIATPTMVYESVFQLPLEREITYESSPPSTMRGLAVDVLQQVSLSDSPCFLVHAFSNGGCFLWEQIRDVRHSFIGNGGTRLPNLIGVVFDSCPGSKLHYIDRALQYCSFSERVQVAINIGIRRYWFLHSKPVEEEIRQRTESYREKLRNDASITPQLYIYSRDDPLCHFDDVDEIVSHRQRLHGKQLIWKRTFESSTHCAHLLRHPEEYRVAVESFLQCCLLEHAKKSELESKFFSAASKL